MSKGRNCCQRKSQTGRRTIKKRARTKRGRRKEKTRTRSQNPSRGAG